MTSTIIVALAQQRIEELTKKLDELAEKIEVISIVLSECNQALKTLIRSGG
jgi:replicative DNA helicase